MSSLKSRSRSIAHLATNITLSEENESSQKLILVKNEHQSKEKEKISQDANREKQRPEDASIYEDYGVIIPQPANISTSGCVNIVSSDIEMANCVEDHNKSQEEYTELVPVDFGRLVYELSSPTSHSSSTFIFNMTNLNETVFEEGQNEYENNDRAETNELDKEMHPEGQNEPGINVNSTPKNTYNGRPKKGRKRKYPDQNREQRKKNCIKNKDYIDQRGKVHEEKEFRQFECKCQCFARVGEENVKQEFKKFYSVDSHDAQRALICNMVREVEIKRKRVKNSNLKNKSRVYQVCNVVVCKTFFMQSFRISSCKIHTALKTMKRPQGVRDMRGIAGGHNKTEEGRVKEVIEHIMKFPKYKSHYCRSTTEREYLNPDTTLAKMYELYKGEVQNPVSLSFYKNIFLTKFNLKRKHLKKDTCSTCDRIDVTLKDCVNNSDLDGLKKEKEDHLKSAEGAQTARKKDMEAATETPELETLCFDLQKTLPLPRIPTNIVYYKRQLCVYNLGIHSGKKNKGHCFVWVEGEAGRGSQEVGSCLRKYILEEVGRGVKNLILWSDSCGGQNRNIKIVLMLKSAIELHPTLETITMKYLFPGHSFLPNDSDFGDIESALKYQQRLYTPEDYMLVMEQCRKKNPLIVHRMNSNGFVGTSKIEENITNRKKDVEKKPVNWLKTRVIEVTRSKPNSIFMKTSLEGQPVEVNIQKNPKRGRPTSHNSFSELCVPLWPNGKPLSNDKLKDLKSLMKFIPADARTVYQTLFSSSAIEDDIEGFNGQVDFEIEE